MIFALLFNKKNKQRKFCIIRNYLIKFSPSLSKQPSTYFVSYKWEGEVQKLKKRNYK